MCFPSTLGLECEEAHGPLLMGPLNPTCGPQGQNPRYNVAGKAVEFFSLFQSFKLGGVSIKTTTKNKP